MHRKRGIVFMAWGERYVGEVHRCIHESVLPDYPLFLLTDEITPVDIPLDNLTVIRESYSLEGKIRKCELIDYLPEGFDSLLLLDSDTLVLEDISLGFDQAEKHGIALAPAPHYSLDYFEKFCHVMIMEGIRPRGELQYNTGVIFFSPNESVVSIFEMWKRLAFKYRKAKWSDQPYFTLAMEKLNFRPYTLSPSYNYRAFGDLISGVIRIWHSREDVPKNINDLNPVWPRRFDRGKIVPHKIVYGSKMRRNLP
jgi:nucleotide-diphospho-sugar transferase